MFKHAKEEEARYLRFGHRANTRERERERINAMPGSL